MYEHKKIVFVLEFDEEDDDKEHSQRSMITHSY